MTPRKGKLTNRRTREELELNRRRWDVATRLHLLHLQCHFGLDTLSWARLEPLSSRAGLVLEWLHELPFCTWKSVLGCEVVQRFGARALYALPASVPQIPRLFSLRARKPAGA